MRQMWAAGVAMSLATAGLVAQDDALTAKARGIHERVMTLDTHKAAAGVVSILRRP